MRFLIDAQLPPALARWVSNTKKAELLSWFEQLLPQIITELEGGESLVEVQ